MARRGRPPKNLADNLADEARAEDAESRLLSTLVVPVSAKVLIYGDDDAIRSVEVKESDGNVTRFGQD